MAAALIKKPCMKCNKGGGVTTCDGCQQTFCMKHIIEHRQELSIELENLVHEHDLLRRDVSQENQVHPLLTQINEWEQESMTRIQVVAENARADLQQLVDESKGNLRLFMDKMTNEVQSGRELDDYTETDLAKWTEKLKELRQLLETQLNVQIIRNDDESIAIRMIKVLDEQLLHSTIASREEPVEKNIIREETLAVPDERFQNFQGRIVLSNDRLLATCFGTYWDGSNVYGTRLYTNGIHEIRFGIEYKGGNSLFFGIRTVSNEMPHQTLTSKYNYGWWELDQGIESVSGHRVHHDKGIRTGDEVTMILDCDNAQIRFEHHRINQNSHLPVDLHKCPFPWKIFITLRSPNDSIRILV
ncbi:unnamed protein product [Adineta steineri]|uniref:Uncharacterized protein n=1 Tax=Adineta steineri TaxID=433720 RepID=A0A813R1Z9_9BILA|nr:unnamed protein product [Adineta steineri]